MLEEPLHTSALSKGHGSTVFRSLKASSFRAEMKSQSRSSADGESFSRRSTILRPKGGTRPDRLPSEWPSKPSATETQRSDCNETSAAPPEVSPPFRGEDVNYRSFQCLERARPRPRHKARKTALGLSPRANLLFALTQSAGYASHPHPAPHIPCLPGAIPPGSSPQPLTPHPAAHPSESFRRE
jgi:hypothetical protein